MLQFLCRAPAACSVSVCAFTAPAATTAATAVQYGPGKPCAVQIPRDGQLCTGRRSAWGGLLTGFRRLSAELQWELR